MRKENKKSKTTTLKTNQAILPDAIPKISSNGFLFFGLILLHLMFLLLSGDTYHSEYSWIKRTWGFDNILFYPNYVIIITYLLLLALCIPFINKKIINLFSFGFWIQVFKKAQKIKYLVFILLSLISIFVFYYFRIRYHFLGDMDIRVKQTVAEQYVDSEYLTMFLLHLLHTFLTNKFAYTGNQTFVLQSVVSGGMFIFFALLISDLSGKSLMEKIVTFMFFISIGAILLFFGYIEIYSIPALSVVIYVYFSLLWLKNKINFILPFLAMILAISFHLLAIGLLPSFFVVLFQKTKNKIPLLNRIKTKPFIIIILVLLPFAFLMAKVFHLGEIMAVTPDEKFPDLMLLFSMKHIWEFINSQILASGLVFFLLIFFAFKGIIGRLKFDNIMWFYSSAAFFMLFITFVSNKMRGSGDWDICAFPALIYSPMVAYFLFRNAEKTKNYPKLEFSLLIIIAINFANTLPWIGINAGDKSIKKIATMLENDPGSYYITRLPSIYNLALSYNANGLKTDALKYYEKIYHKYNNDPRSHLNYAKLLIELDKEKEAAVVLNNLINQVPYISMSYPLLINIYQKHKMYDEIYRILNMLFTNFQNNPNAFISNFDKKNLVDYFNFLCQTEIGKGNIEKAQNIKLVIDRLHAN